MQSVHTARAHTVCTATLRYFGTKKGDILYIISVYHFARRAAAADRDGIQIAAASFKITMPSMGDARASAQIQILRAVEADRDADAPSFWPFVEEDGTFKTDSRTQKFSNSRNRCRRR